MNDDKQIVLFLKKGTTFNQVQIAARLNEKFSELGIPITLPIDEKNPNAPLIVFNKGLVEISMNYDTLSFIYDRGSKDARDISIKVTEFMENENIEFVRFGYVSTYIRTKKQ